MSTYSTVNEAARNGSVDEVKRLVSKGHPVDAMDNRGWRPVHEAAARNNIDCLCELLSIDITDVRWTSHEGCSPLWLAVEQGHLAAATILLDHGADPDQTDCMHNTPLHLAVKSGNPQLVQLLVSNGASVNCQQYCGSSPLHLVASEGRLDMLRILLQAGARLNIYEEYHISPLFSAAQYGQHSCLQALLHHAKNTNNEEMVNMAADDGGTPLYLAAQEGHVDCVRELLQSGADANLMTSDPVALPLHAALQFAHVDCVHLLLPHTNAAKFRCCDISPFDFATSHSDPACLNCLIAAGIDVNYRHTLQDDNFEPRIMRYFNHSVAYSSRVHPLVSLGLYRNPISNAEILLKAGARVNPYGYEVPPFLVALDYFNLDYARLLILYGADINVYHPCIVGNMSTIVCLHYWKGLNFLLRCGADATENFSYDKLLCYVRHRTLREGGLVANYSDNDDSGEEAQGSQGDQTPLSFYETLTGARYAMARRTVTVGMVLYQMLQFVGNVKMDPRLESLMDLAEDWKTLQAFTECPRSLMHLSRLAVRRAVGAKRLLSVCSLQSLPLPQPIIDYLLYTELDPEQPPSMA